MGEGGVVEKTGSEVNRFPLAVRVYRERSSFSWGA